MRIEVGEAPVPLKVLRKAWLDQVTVVLSGGARRRIAAAADTIKAAIKGGRPIYGVNTGCGHLAHVRIGDERTGRSSRRTSFARTRRGWARISATGSCAS